MRSDGRIGLLILAIGIAPAIIKKSKPFSRYVGDQLVRLGEYLKEGTDEATGSAQEIVETKAEEVTPDPMKEEEKSPAGPYETFEHENAEILGDNATTEHRDPTESNETPKPEAPQPENPKDTDPE